MKDTVSSLIAIAILTSPVGAQPPHAKIEVHADKILHGVSPYLTGACIEDVNHEVYGGIDSQMIFGEHFAEPALKRGAESNGDDGVSGVWRPMRRGSAKGRFQLDKDNAFRGKQSQRITFVGGTGEFGIENQGLNRWGMNFIAGKEYDGQVWARADKPTVFFVALASRDGAKVHAEKRLEVSGNAWQRVDFHLTPDTSDKAGRFAIKLKKPGSITLGYAFLQPGAWGRFKNLPVRKDVADGLVSQGITVLRQGGSMVNAAEYRWKNMIGPRAKRRPYKGTWYPYSSNGWGIIEFLDFCRVAGFLGIPDVNMDEAPADMAAFIEYVNGPATSAWGRRRALTGQLTSYGLKYLELGNEERVDEKYAAKFEALAKAIWAKDADVILVVGDFAYSRPIVDPFNFRGAASRITTLAAHRRILQFAKRHNREVWFDVHVGTEGPRPDASLAGMFSFRDALDKIADGARHQVVVFELNANNHTQRRALANALAIQAIERDGRIPIVTSANCLQPDGQNNNGWNQGLLFLSPSQVWLQPPGYVTQLFSRNRLPNLVDCQVTGANGSLDVNATKSADGRTLIVKAVNPTDQPVAADIRVTGFVTKSESAHVAELSAALNAANTAAQPKAVVPRYRPWRHGLKDGQATYAFPARSITVVKFE